MASKDQQQGETSRKRKHKFTESEQEVLIQEMVVSHEHLFGKKSLRVPETRKRRIWADIQRKVNAIGVTHRSVKDLQKRWYDMRARSKEKVAARLEEANKTGGGSSTATASTPLEEMVEGTLLPESVMGVADLDSSDHPQPGQAPSETQGRISGGEDESPSPEATGQEEEEEEEDEGSPVILPTRRRRSAVPPLPPLEEEGQDTDGDVQPVRGQSEPQPRARARAVTTPPVTSRRRAPRASTSAADTGDDTVFQGLEGQMLQVQRLQARNMRTIQRQIRVGFMGLTGALEALCAELRADRAARRRERQRLHTRLDLYTRAVNRLSTATSVLSRRSISMQHEVAHCSQDVARGLVQVTCAVDELRAAATAGTGVLTPTDEDAQSSRSSITPPPPPDRRRSVRHGRAAEAGEEGTVHPRRGATGRQRRS